MPDQPGPASGPERRRDTGSAVDVHHAAPWLVAIVGLGLAVNAVSDRTMTVDGFYDLYAGRYIVAHGLPHTNTITVASHGAPWIDQQWLAHVLYYGAWAMGGYPAVAALSAMLVTSGFAILALAMRSLGVPPARMFTWTIAAVIVCAANTVIRAQSFAYPLLALTLWLLVTDSRSPRLRARTWLLIPVLVIWANTHGSVLVGAALAVLYSAYRIAVALHTRRHHQVPAYLALGAAAAVSVVCTPYGIGIAQYYERVDGVTPVLARTIPEWAPSSPLDLISWPFFALVAATAAAVVAAWRRGTKPDPLLAVLALLLFGLALAAVRNQVWFAFGGGLLAADTLARSRGGHVDTVSRAFSRAMAGLLAAAALAGFVLLAVTPDARFEVQAPLRALRAAAALSAWDPHARVLGDDECGPAMLWLYPTTAGRVGFDARLEQYTPAQLGAYASFLSGRGRAWQRVMNSYGIVVVSSAIRPQLAGALTRLPGWRVVFSGDGGLVAVRRPMT